MKYLTLTIAFESEANVEDALRWHRYRRHDWVHGNPRAAFALYNRRGISELWVHKQDKCVEIYKRFLVEAVGVTDIGKGLKGLEIDHAYSRTRAIRKETGDHLLLSPVAKRVNGNHGYTERVRSLDKREAKPVATRISLFSQS